MEQIALGVSDLECPEAERTVTSALINEPGVFWATAAARDGLASVRYDPERTDLDRLREAVRAAGHDPEPLISE